MLGPPLLTRLVRGYVVVATATVVALAVLAVVAPDQAPSDAWVHALIVAGFAVLLPLRLRSARAGNRGALRAVGVIGAVLLLVNVVEGLLPGAFPVWMRVEMFAIAVLMAAVVTTVAVVAGRHEPLATTGRS